MSDNTNSKVTALTGNLNRTFNPQQTKNEDVRFALNAIRDSITGDKVSYQSEPGNTHIYDLPDGLLEIGKIYGEDGTVYLFSTDGNGNDEIGYQRKNKYHTLVRANFGFTYDGIIKGVYRVFRGCERVLYWCDGINPDRFFNVDNPKRFQDDDGNWIVNLFSLQPEIINPEVNIEEVANSGGSIRTGKYFFQLEILDDSLNIIHRTPITNGVNIYSDSTTNEYDNIQGNYNYPEYAVTQGGKPITNKSILLSVDNIDRRFRYARFNVIQATGGQGIGASGYTLSDLIPISSGTITYLFNGIKDTDISQPVSKFITPLARYVSSEGMTQKDNKLVRINVKEAKRDYSEYQRFASRVGVRYAINEVDAKDANALGNPKNPQTPFNMMSAMGDEVVALGVKFIHSDGEISPAFHIPGICKDAFTVGDPRQCRKIVLTATQDFNPEGQCLTINVLVNINVDGQLLQIPATIDFTEGLQAAVTLEPIYYSSGFSINSIEILNEEFLICTVNIDWEAIECEPGEGDPQEGDIPENWHSDIINKEDDINAEHLDKPLLDEDGKVVIEDGEIVRRDEYERWEVYNTAYKLSEFSGYMGYHENPSTKYLPLKDCEGNSIWGKDICNRELEGTPIRHHRLPDRNLEPHYKAEGSAISQTAWCINVLVTGDSDNAPYVPIELEFQYDLDGDTITETYLYSNFNEEVCFFTTPSEPTNITITDLTQEPDNGTLDISFTVTQEEFSTDNTQNEVIRLIGFDFYNVEYPSDDIVGHIFVIADYESTVISKGYTTPLSAMSQRTPEGYKEQIYGFGKTDNGVSASQIGSDQIHSMISPELLFNRATVSGEYFKSENTAIESVNNLDNLDIRQSGVFGGNPDLFFYGKSSFFKNVSTNVNRVNSPIQETAAIDPQARYQFSPTEVATNLTLNNKTLFINSPIATTMGNLTYGGVKVEREVYRDLFSIRYRDLHHNPTTIRSGFKVFGGNTYIGNMKYVNTLFALYVGSNWLFGLFGFLGFLVFLVNQTASATREITRYFRQYIRNREPGYNSSVSQLISALNPFSDSYIMKAHLLEDLYFESKINVALQNETQDVANDIYKTGSVSHFLMRTHTDKTKVEGGVFTYNIQDTPSYYPYIYNQDFSRLNDFMKTFPLPAFYDYCSKCDREFPNRIIHSPVSNEEDIYDLYRVTLALDYKDMPAHRGPLNEVFAKNDRLLVLADQTAYVLIASPQSINTDQSTIFLTTGNFLGVPPQELIESEVGYAGCQSKLNAINTIAGLVWWDQIRGQIFLFDNKIKELSLEEMSQWFMENSPSTLTNQLENDYGIVIKDNVFKGVGTIATYDPRFKRYILHKKDYRLLLEDLPTDPIDVSPQGYGIFPDGRVYQKDIFNKLIPVPFTNKDVYEDKSFTLSYSFEYGGWTSWHSYKPRFMFNDELNFYASMQGDIHRHLHNGNFQTYFDKKFPFIVDYISNEYITNDLNAIHYVGYSLFYDEAHKQWVDYSDKYTFDGIMIYNSNYNTGYIKLNLVDQNSDFYSNIAYIPDERNVIRTDDNYKISKLYNYATGLPTVTSDWEVLKDEIDIYGYIDKLPFNIDFNTNQYELANIKGKWVAVRLFFNPEEDVKKIIHLIHNSDTPSIR